MLAFVFAAVSLLQHLTVDGIDRTYHLYRPPSLSASSAVPLVVVLHGGFGTGAQAEKAYGWDAAADRHGFAVVYPDGLNRAWNAGWCCGTPQRRTIDDVKFLAAVIEDVERSQPIDAHRVAVAGMSNGAMMAYRMACESPIPLHAVGSVSGTMVTPCASAKPTPVIEIHGLQDAHVPFDGSPGKGVARVHGMPIPSVIDRWRSIDGCTTATTVKAGVVTTEASSCANGSAVELITIADAGHQWPGSKRDPLASAAARMIDILPPDQPSSALDATETLYRFFFE